MPFAAWTWDAGRNEGPLARLHRDWAHPRHICAGTGLTPATSAPGLGSPRPHLRRDWAHPGHICARTGRTEPAKASATRTVRGSDEARESVRAQTWASVIAHIRSARAERSRALKGSGGAVPVTRVTECSRLQRGTDPQSVTLQPTSRPSPCTCACTCRRHRSAPLRCRAFTSAVDLRPAARRRFTLAGERSPGAHVAGASQVLMQMCRGQRSPDPIRTALGERSPGADVAGVSQVLMPMWQRRAQPRGMPGRADCARRSKALSASSGLTCRHPHLSPSSQFRWGKPSPDPMRTWASPILVKMWQG